MSTRSVILAFDGQEVIRFYRHSDGYPTAVLPALTTILKDPLLNMDDLISRIDKEQVARIDDDWGDDDKGQYKSDKVKLEHWGNQGDLEWLYYLDLRDHSLNIYHAGYGCPEEHLKKGPTNPEIYVKALYPEYQKKELKQIQKGVKDLQKLNWTINAPKSVKYVKKIISQSHKEAL